MNHPAVEKAAKECRLAITRNWTSLRYRSYRLDTIIAALIERETKYSRLVEAAELACKEQIFMGWAIAANERRRGIHEKLRSVLAEIKELGNGPRRCS